MTSIKQLGRILYRALPWCVEATAYSLFCGLFVPFFENWASLVFLTQLIVGLYSDRYLWAKKETFRPQLLAAVWPLGVAISATCIFSTTSLIVLVKVVFFAVIVSVTKYLVLELQNLSRIK